MARTTAASPGFGTTVINLHRPARDDFETVVVEGSEGARSVLLGRTSTRADWEPLLDPRFEASAGAYLIRHGDYDWSQDRLASYIPDAATSADPDAWHPEDALLVPLRSTAGELLGILSVDEPLDGRRPDHNRLDLLVGVAQHAALALETAQQAAAAERQRAAVDHLLALTARMTEGRTHEELLEAVCAGIRDALGFQKVCVFLGAEGTLDPGAAVGFSAGERARLAPVPFAALVGVLDPALCFRRRSCCARCGRSRTTRWARSSPPRARAHAPSGRARPADRAAQPTRTAGAHRRRDRARRRLAARLGGEEFALVLPGLDEREALAVGERLRADVAARFGDFPWVLTTSVGVAVSGTGTGTAVLLMRAATPAASSTPGWSRRSWTRSSGGV